MADRLQTPVTTVSETQKKMGPTRLVRNLIFGWRLLLWVKLRTVVEPRQEVSNRRKHERFGVQTGYIHMFKLPEYPSKTSRKSTDSRRPFPSPQMSHPPYLVRAKRSNTLNVNSKSEHRQKKKKLYKRRFQRGSRRSRDVPLESRDVWKCGRSCSCETVT